jgi:hypothetical protein
MRFIVFLDVAFRQCFFEIASPSRAGRPPLPLQSTVNHRSRLRLACSNTRPNAAASSNRLCRRNRKNALRDLPGSNPGGSCVACRAGSRLRRQLLTTLGAAALENKPAGLCRHTGAEAMRACALQGAGLIRTFHVPATCVFGRCPDAARKRVGKGTRALFQCQSRGREGPLPGAIIRENHDLAAADYTV